MDWLLLAICIALIAGCGLFGAAEYSLVAVDRAQIEAAAREGDKQARGVSLALSRLSTQLSGAQVGITITNLAIGFLAEPSIADLLHSPMRAIGISTSLREGLSVAVGMVLATVGTMLFGELIPKKIAIARPDGTARRTQGFLRAFSSIVRGPIWLLNGSANALVRLVGVTPQEELRSARTTDELAALAEHSASEGTLDTETATLVQRSVAFGPRTAGEIMTPRVQMEALERNATVRDLIALSAATGFSQFPVIKGSNDNIVGAVHVKQAVTVPRQDRESRRIREIMVEMPVVPETLRLDPLLTLRTSGGFQMAAVSDDSGGTAGIVTLEDVVEEIVGEIADEHDPRGSRLRRRPDGSWLISGLLRPDEVEESTGIDLPEDEAYDTVAGLLVRELGHIPHRGEEAMVRLADELGDDDEMHPRYAVLRVEVMDALRVDRISIRLLGSLNDEVR
ncbi:MAG: hemolysin family protein [Marmoricola sp.]